jgi:hypothetical protein
MLLNRLVREVGGGAARRRRGTGGILNDVDGPDPTHATFRAITPWRPRRKAAQELTNLAESRKKPSVPSRRLKSAKRRVMHTFLKIRADRLRSSPHASHMTGASIPVDGEKPAD